MDHLKKTWNNTDNFPDKAEKCSLDQGYKNSEDHFELHIKKRIDNSLVKGGVCIELAYGCGRFSIKM